MQPPCHNILLLSRPHRSINFLFLCVRSAVSLHNTLLKHIMRLPKPFFDTNPAGEQCLFKFCVFRSDDVSA